MKGYREKEREVGCADRISEWVREMIICKQASFRVDEEVYRAQWHEISVCL